MTKEEMEPTVAEKLKLLKSPIVGGDRPESLPSTEPTTAPDLSLFGNRFEADCPQFQKHEDASLLELFFDLFFAANYTVFSETQGVNSHDRFKAYVGYFSVLWITWLVTSLYDVRFVTDSLFEAKERAARGVHLGVMVGFAVVAPKFTPDEQNVKTMRTMSLILMVSRLCLAVEYASILWHIRKYKKQALPMLMQISMNFIIAMIYLGITFRFREGNSHVFITWYILAGVEVFLTFAFAYIWPVLSFRGTHLMKRMGLLTVIILGDGIIVISKSVVTIVESPDAWDSQTIGIVTAASTAVYAVFLVYFDWMKNPYLPHFRQQLWTILHFPFHLALVLFMQGFTQFVIWTKIIDTLNHLTLDSVLNDLNDIAKSTSKSIKDDLSKMISDYFELYPPKYASTWTTVDDALANISSIANDFWPQFAKYADTLQDKDLPDSDDFNTFANAFYAISYSMENALLETFGIDLVKEVSEENEHDHIEQTDSGLEAQVNDETWVRFELVFQYSYIAAGITLILMVLLAVISRTTPWTKWSIARNVIFTLLGVGMSLVALLNYNANDAVAFQTSAWMLPTITLVWLVILILTHIRNPPPLFFSGSQSFWSKKKSQPSYDYVMPSEGQTEYRGAPHTQA
ncbi:bacterial low temperature requirement a [Fusarium albosuccineum]|uniref:Bacterial low temperature requirement a n=1 Tax=Fusarium albosuccineum TaxID=1237068 RepID=A0A8H4LNR1_9HYPO|nr:bacterial low temperature requirement a [Fusarium albosuccineum]